MGYWAFRLAAAAARRAPLRAAYAFATLGGLLTYYGWWGGRRRCVRNMRHVAAGNAALARKLARRSFVYYALYLVDFLRFTSVTREEVRDRVLFEEWDALDAQRAGNGTVFITMHFGNWDLGAAALAEHGVPISVIADTFAERRMNELVLGARRHLGMDIVPAERMGPGILRALRRNEVVAMLIDVPSNGAGVHVEFFDGTIAVADGPARIALRSGANVVAVTLPRVGRWSDRVRGQIQPVPFEATGDFERDVRALTQRTMRALEGMVSRNPEQWYIFRHLWLADRAPEPA